MLALLGSVASQQKPIFPLYTEGTQNLPWQSAGERVHFYENSMKFSLSMDSAEAWCTNTGQITAPVRNLNVEYHVFGVNVGQYMEVTIKITFTDETLTKRVRYEHVHGGGDPHIVTVGLPSSSIARDDFSVALIRCEYSSLQRSAVVVHKVWLSS